MKKNGYSGLWLLLALALIIVLTVSFCDDFSIGGWNVKRAPYREMLLKDEKAEALKAAIEDSIIQAKRDSIENAVVVVDSVPQSILLIGDSMTMNLAFRMAQYAKANGHSFHAVNWDSSGTVKWAGSDRLDNYIKEFGATYVFISLGSNELYIKNPESHLKYVQAILDKVGDLPYVWLGPPNWKEDFGINDMIERTCRPGSFFRTAGMEFKRKKDGIHPTRGASALWIDSVARWLPKSSHPILFDTPAEDMEKVNPNLVLLKATDK